MTVAIRVTYYSDPLSGRKRQTPAESGAIAAFLAERGAQKVPTRFAVETPNAAVECEAAARAVAVDTSARQYGGSLSLAQQRKKAGAIMRAKAVALWLETPSTAAIATILGVNKKTVYRYLAREGICTTPPRKGGK